MADTNKENADRIVLWAAQKTQAEAVVAFYPGFHADAIKGGLDKRRLAQRLREYAAQLEGD